MSTQTTYDDSYTIVIPTSEQHDDSYTIVIPTSEQHDFMKEINKKKKITMKDKGGRSCTVILDNDGFPHRKDIPCMYLQLSCSSIMDIVTIMDIFEENGKKHSSFGNYKETKTFSNGP